MSTWICLVRGVNLGAANKLNMPALRAALSEPGLSEVWTYIQSGNVIVNSDLSQAGEVAQLVAKVISNQIGLDFPVIVPTPERIRQLASWCPFRQEAPEVASSTSCISPRGPTQIA